MAKKPTPKKATSKTRAKQQPAPSKTTKPSPDKGPVVTSALTAIAYSPAVRKDVQDLALRLLLEPELKTSDIGAENSHLLGQHIAAVVREGFEMDKRRAPSVELYAMLMLATHTAEILRNPQGCTPEIAAKCRTVVQMLNGLRTGIAFALGMGDAKNLIDDLSETAEKLKSAVLGARVAGATA